MHPGKQHETMRHNELHVDIVLNVIDELYIKGTGLHQISKTEPRVMRAALLRAHIDRQQTSRPRL